MYYLFTNLKENLTKKSDEELYFMIKSNSNVANYAFDEIYNRYSVKIYTYCRKVLKNTAAADDIFQDTFTNFYESIKKEKTMTNLNGYLIRIARNLCISEKHKKNNQILNVEDYSIPTYDKSYDNKQLMDLLDTALESLPEIYREVIIFKEFMNMTYNEIAEVLNINMPMVRIRIYRAKSKIREILQPYLEELRDFE